MKTGMIDGKPVDLEAFVTSTSTIKRKRDENRGILMNMVMEEFSLNKPEHINLHWDSKLIESISGELKEYEAILASGAPEYIEGKLLSVTQLTDDEGKATSTGKAQFEAVREQVRLWDIRGNIRSMTFDTTSSNTGWRKGCTVLLERDLGRPLFYFGCRHHFIELIAKAAWYSIFEEDLSPENSFFRSFKDLWPELDTKADTPIVTLLDAPGKEEALQFYREILSRRNQHGELALRDDYRELAELALRLLGECPETGRLEETRGLSQGEVLCIWHLHFEDVRVQQPDRLGQEGQEGLAQDRRLHGHHIRAILALCLKWE